MLTWTHLNSGFGKTGDLELAWEVNGDPISDDYAGTNDIAAEDLLRLWVKQSYPSAKVETTFGLGTVSIYWSLRGDAMEQAPFARKEMSFYGEDVLKQYSWPVDSATGERLNFNTLPVRDKVWTAKHWDKGGFIQEATGWKPSPFQPVMDVPTVFAAAGLSHLLPRR